MELLLPHFVTTNTRQHVFLEVGGYNGIHESNTIYLQRCLGWAGLMIEAQPILFDMLLENRPGVATLHSALSAKCDPPGSVRFSATTGTGGAIRGAPTRPNEVNRSVAVPCAPLRHYLDALGMAHVSFLSLDVEGAELEVVRSIDWQRQSVAAMVVEELQLGASSERNARLGSYLRGSTPMRWAFTACWHPKGAVCDSYWVDPRFVDMAALAAANATYDHHAIRGARAGAVHATVGNPRCHARST